MSFVYGLIVGGIVWMLLGVLMMSLCVIAKRSDPDSH